jgi:hypothetical protein
MLKKVVEGGYLGPAYFQPNQTPPVFQKDQSASLPIGDPTVGVTPSPQFNATAPDSSSCWGGVRKPAGVLEHKSFETGSQASSLEPRKVRKRGISESLCERWGNEESPKACVRLKSCESLYMCPRTPFYREMKGLLHSEITLESKEYSLCEHVQECLLHPLICGANFIHLQACHYFTL